MNEWLHSHLPVVSASERDRLAAEIRRLERELAQSNDRLAYVTLQLETLKNKIVARAEQQPTIKAKSAAEIRRMVEIQNEREFEESANGAGG